MTAQFDRLAEFQLAFPDYAYTAGLDALRASQYSCLDACAQVYVDYAGACLPARAQLEAHVARVTGGCFGNPHSEHPPSAASTTLIGRARNAVLAHCNASPDEYAVIFTHNASAACRLVGEAYDFGAGRCLVLTSDNHNSVNGIREFARAAGAPIEYVPFSSASLRVDDEQVRSALRWARSATRSGFAGRDRPGQAGLFAYPAQSNFSGVRHALSWVEEAQELGYDVLLDAAAFLPNNRLDLSVVRPDFVPISWYKVFGYPTGVGCLIARHEALGRLRRPWFSGGTISAVSVQGDWHALAADEARFEDGTPSFLHIPDVEVGLDWINAVGLPVIGDRVRCLTGWMLGRLAGLRHSNGAPLVGLYGPEDTAQRGGIVAFRVLDRNGGLVDSRIVGSDAAAAGIAVRTGCFCNPGASEAAFGLSREMIAAAQASDAVTADAYYDVAGIAGGAVRASLGVVSTIGDVEALVGFIEAVYTDRPGQSCRDAARSLEPDLVSAQARM
jgi:selenocysteine lyase/cysteine desulfurase